MNMGTKSKKRMVLPSRPEPPTVEQIIEDLNRAYPNDPVFIVLQSSNEERGNSSSSSDVEERYLQSRRYLDLNEKLQAARTDLVNQREQLRAAGETLESVVAEVRGRAL